MFVNLSGIGDFSILRGLLVCTFVFGRETLIDVKDIEYDLRAKLGTLATRVGPKRPRIGWALMLCSTIGLIPASWSTAAMPLAVAAAAFVALTTLVIRIAEPAFSVDAVCNALRCLSPASDQVKGQCIARGAQMAILSFSSRPIGVTPRRV